MIPLCSVTHSFDMAVNTKVATISAIASVVIAISIASMKINTKTVKEEPVIEKPFELHLDNSVRRDTREIRRRLTRCCPLRRTTTMVRKRYRTAGVCITLRSRTRIRAE